MLKMIIESVVFYLCPAAPVPANSHYNAYISSQYTFQHIGGPVVTSLVSQVTHLTSDQTQLHLVTRSG